MNPIRRTPRTRPTRHAVWLLVALWLMPLPSTAIEAQPPAPHPADLQRLFFTPAQRADLQARRAHARSVHVAPGQAGASDAIPVPIQFDGELIRSDGKTTRWVDGKAQAGAAGISSMKPGQIRANGKLYEPYQVQRPQPAADNEKEAMP